MNNWNIAILLLITKGAKHGIINCFMMSSRPDAAPPLKLPKKSSPQKLPKKSS